VKSEQGVAILSYFCIWCAISLSLIYDAMDDPEIIAEYDDMQSAALESIMSVASCSSDVSLLSTRYSTYRVKSLTTAVELPFLRYLKLFFRHGITVQAVEMCVNETLCPKISNS
jgi:hypothetical protein